MKRFKVLIATALLGFCASCQQDEEPKYTRSECIVGIVFDKPLTQELQQLLSDAFHRSKIDGNNQFSAVVMPSNNNDYLKMYIQLNSECENKFSIVDSFFNDYLTEINSYKFIQQSIEPGVDTIEVTGPSWKQ